MAANTARTTNLYSDFRNDFLLHPVKKDLVLNTNEQAVISSIRNIVMTDPYEKFFIPTFGGGIRSLLFEDVSETTEFLIRNRIRESIENYEPRARILQVYVTARPDDNAYAITIIFSLINRQEPITATFLLNRIR